MKNKKLLIFIIIALLLFLALVFLIYPWHKKVTKPKRPLQGLLEQGVVAENVPKTDNPITNKILGLVDINSDEVDGNAIPKDEGPENNSESNGDRDSESTTKKGKNSSNSSSAASNSSNTSEPALDIDLFVKKLNYISGTTKNTAKETNVAFTDQEIQNIFIDDLVTVFGKAKLEKVFKDIEKIDFTNPQVSGNEGLATAILQKNDGSLLTYKTYFYFKNGDWYMYKTLEQ